MEDLQLSVEYLRLQPASLANLRNRLSLGPLHYSFLQTKLVGPLNLVRGIREETLTVSRGNVAELAIVCLQRENRNQADYRTNYRDFRTSDLSFAMVPHCLLSRVFSNFIGIADASEWDAVPNLRLHSRCELWRRNPGSLKNFEDLSCYVMIYTRTCTPG